MSVAYSGNSTGFVLLPVVLAIMVIAAIAFLINQESAVQLNIASRELQTNKAQYVAEAGIQHAIWKADRSNCMAYSAETDTLGAHSYSISYTPTKGSPVAINSVGTLADGASYTLTRDNQKIYNNAITTVLQPAAATGKDSFISGEAVSTTLNNGNIAYFKTSSETGAQLRTLLQFDLSSIPDRATIRTATLELYLNTNEGTEDTITAHRLLRSWTEDGVSWNTYDGSEPWATAGGDYETQAASAFVASGTGWKSLNLVTLVQSWIDGSATNNGIILLSAAAPGSNDKTFISSDDTDATKHPKLSITYACECGIECTVDADKAGNLLFLVGNEVLLDAGDSARKSLIESWGYTVTLIDDGKNQTLINKALANNDVAYISETVDAATLSTKLNAATIGVIYEEYPLHDEFGLASNSYSWPESDIVVSNNSHYITQAFPLGDLTLFSSSQDASYLSGSLAGGLRTLGTFQGNPALAVVEKGKNLISGTASGRRVQLPWGESNLFDFDTLNSDGQMILKRALEWGKEDPASCQYETSEFVRISNGIDDVEERVTNQSMHLNSADIEFGSDPGFSTDNLVGFRFQDLDIPQGSKIIGAYIDLAIDEVDTAQTDINFTGEASDNAATFSNTDGDLSGRTKTASAVQWLDVPPWTNVGATITTPDLSDIVQEVMDRPGWTKGNSLVVIANSAGRRTAESYEGSATFAPALRVYFCSSEAPRDPSIDLVAHWQLDETSGIGALDSHGSHDGTLANGPLWDAGGYINGALDFDGVDDRITVPHDTSLSLTSEITMMAWIKNHSTSPSSAHRILSKEQNGQNDGYWMAVLGTTIYVGVGGSVLSSSTSMIANQWYHIAVSFNDADNELRIYIDGTPQSIQSTNATLNTNTADLQIGNSWQDKAWNGLLDDIRIYKRVFDTVEISTLVNGS